MEDTIKTYLLTHTLEEITAEWHKQRELADTTKYVGWIDYIISHRGQQTICDLLWRLTAWTIQERGEEFRQKLMDNDPVSFQELKDHLFDTILHDTSMLNKLFKTGRIKEKRELFKMTRNKFYL